jgi:hypothetical protein
MSSEACNLLAEIGSPSAEEEITSGLIFTLLAMGAKFASVLVRVDVGRSAMSSTKMRRCGSLS